MTTQEKLQQHIFRILDILDPRHDFAINFSFSFTIYCVIAFGKMLQIRLERNEKEIGLEL